MKLLKLSLDQYFAIMWFTLGLFVLMLMFAITFGKAPVSLLGLLMMSILCFMLSAQKTKRFSIAKEKFNKGMLYGAFSTVIFNILAIIFNQMVNSL